MAHFATEREIIARQVTNRLDEIKTTIYRNRMGITEWKTVVTGRRQDVAPVPTDGWVPFEVGSQWGGYDVTQWFRTIVTIPDEFKGKKTVALLRPGFEGLCFVNGQPLQGLDANRDEIVLTECAEGNETFDIAIEAYGGSRPRIDYNHTFQYANIATRDDLVWNLYWDFKIAFDSATSMPADSTSRVRILDLINQQIKRIDLNEVDDIETYRAQVTDVRKNSRQVLGSYQKSDGNGELALVGHAHIDTAWLWRLAETRRKCGRTFSTVLKYMDEYPDYKFSQSQPQLHEFVKDNYPVLWEKIKQRVAEGRWEPMGGGWVEQDSNVSGAEALVRQLVYGNRFYLKEFGKFTPAVWLPDAFGYPIQLPQIIRKAQLTSFNTTKIGWNQYNEFPYTMFMWRGLDGTEVLSVMHPCGRRGYNGAVTPPDLVSHWQRFKQKDSANEVWYPFGYGDGGGGPTKEDLENGVRLKDGMVGIPKVRFSTLEELFARLEKDVDTDRLPVFNDELYFELHRGCQTTQARTKRNNRLAELAMRDAELLGAFAMQSGYEYPQDELYQAWKPLLTNQFHDILPGSSIKEVYDEADQDYAKIIGTGRKVRDAALKTIVDRVDTSGPGTPIVVTNTLGWVRTDVAETILSSPLGDDETIVDAAGRPVPCQLVSGKGGGQVALFEASEIPSTGYAVYRVARSKPADIVASELRVSETKLENRFFSVYLTKTGTIRRIVDKANNREVIPDGFEANEMQLFDDRPQNWDAWDVDFNLDEQCSSIDDVVSISVVEEGPVRGTVRVVKKTKRSTITQDISIYRNITRIDFRSSVDWFEKRRMLKVVFPVEVLSRTATYEVQYGAIERPTHQSTSIDRAKFEVPGHRWIDLSEGDYGVSILNDSKYGFDVLGNRMRISLLRSTVNPDPHADEGRHEFTYSLYPHAGDWRDAKTVQRAYELNAPLVAKRADAHDGELPKTYGFISVDCPNVVIDCVKKAEDSDAVIVRLYEAHGARSNVNLGFAKKPATINECDLMEENDVPVEIRGSSARFVIKPWEIRTFKVQF